MTTAQQILAASSTITFVALIAIVYIHTRIAILRNKLK